MSGITGFWKHAATGLCACLLLVAWLAPGAAQAKQGEFGLSLSVGSGFLVGKTDDPLAPSSSIAERQPTLLDMDFQYEVLPWLAPSLRVEMTVEGGEALTLAPGVVFDSDGDVVTFFGRAAVAIHIKPNYYGMDLGAGVIWHFMRHLGLAAELHLEPFFAGDGLTGGFLMPIMVTLGLRGNV
jgi:hypothetical protein